MASGATKANISGRDFDLNILLQYNAACLKTQRYAISVFMQEQRGRGILAYFFILLCFLRFYMIEIYLHAVFLHDIL